jgi:D-alanyl-D-alanine carboxypeptidase
MRGLGLAILLLSWGCDGEGSQGKDSVSQGDSGVDTDTGTTLDTATETTPYETPPVDLGPILGPALAGGVPALGAAVFDQDALLAIGAAGVRSVDQGAPVQTDDPWHLGSETKAMTATLVATFVDEGALDWETPIPELFPALAVDPAWDEVTLEQLLHHTSGMGDAGDHLDWWNEMWLADDPVAQRAVFAAQVFAAPPDYAVDTYRYSNFGYIAVGAALEALTGAAWEDLLRARLFEPLGMTSCGFGPPGGDAPWGHSGVAGGYLAMDPGTLGADNPATLGPAGTVHCALADWGRFGAEHLAGAAGAGTVASAEAFARMHTPPPGGTYAAGWGVGTVPEFGGALLSHDGSNTMWYASMVVALDAGRVYLVTANAGDAVAVDAVYEVLFALPDAR